MIKPFKYVIQPVAVEVDAAGRVIREIVGDPAQLYTPAQVEEFVGTIEAQLVAAEE